MLGRLVEAAGRSPLAMIRLLLALAVFFLMPAAHALEGLSLDIAAIDGKHWQMQGIRIALTGLAKSPQQLALTINSLTLTKPFDDLSLVNIRCSDFTWHDKSLNCQQGRVQLRSKQWQSPSANFSFHIKENHSKFHLDDVRLAGAHFTVDGEEIGEQWQLRINAQAVNEQLVQKLLPTASFELKYASLGFRLSASGRGASIKDFALRAKVEDLSGQSPDGRFAAEALTLALHLDAVNRQGLWQWQSHSEFKAGAMYVEPLYLPVAAQTIVLDTEGDWNPAGDEVDIRSVRYRHPGVAELIGSASIQSGKTLNVDQAELSLNSSDLAAFSAIYLKPFFEASALEGVSLAGRMNAGLSIKQQAVAAMKLAFEKLDVKDEAARFGMRGGAGTINWSNQETYDKPSELAWQQLQLRALPIGPSRLTFLSRANTVQLLGKTRLPFLGGSIAVKEFKWRGQQQQEPEVYFEGRVDNVSLEELSTALDWTPLSGKISGDIPGVDYSNNTLSLGGELIIKVFDGEVKVSNLASSGLFTDFPKLHAEVEIDHLDLDQLTRKFEFGGIQGRLSGFVRNLYMENWKPVSFYAWFGTPEDDDSTHRISQKAVKNIANIGGGGAADLLSRSFLGLFETFMYDKIGMGCYLHDGVCQLMGVEAAEQGYYIIKGGGLPRIDVIGYNPRVDWNVLMERLRRISTSDEVIIE